MNQRFCDLSSAFISCTAKERSDNPRYLQLESFGVINNFFGLIHAYLYDKYMYIYADNF